MVFLKSARSVEAITKPGYHRCGRGLYLQVTINGTKSWIFRYKSPVTHKQREMGLGSLNIVSLAKAREIASECHLQLLKAIDPIEERKRIKQTALLKQAKAMTFEEVAERCIDSKKPEWKNVKHVQQWSNSLKAYAYPVFGKLSISDLTTDLILKSLEPIWITKTETATRVRQRIETVWDWAKARGYVDGENPARLRGHLDKLLANPAKVKKVKHHAAVAYCVLAVERDLKLCAPIHDALLIESSNDQIDTDVTKLKECMSEASEGVLGNGKICRVDAEIVKYPDRYMDDQGQEMWDKIMILLAKRQGQLTRYPRNTDALST